MVPVSNVLPSSAMRWWTVPASPAYPKKSPLYQVTVFCDASEMTSSVGENAFGPARGAAWTMATSWGGGGAVSLLPESPPQDHVAVSTISSASAAHQRG